MLNLQPVIWMYFGSVTSVLEAIPLGFLLVYALLLLRRSRIQNQLQRTLVTFVAVAGIGGGIGAVGLGAGLFNLPYVNYYLHDLRTTMAHTHLAFPLAYGLPSMLMWVVAFVFVGKLTDRDLKLASLGAIIMGVGFYLQAFITLLPLGALQLSKEMSFGYWFAKSIFAPIGDVGFWQLPVVQQLVWIRMFGDVVAGIGMGIIALIVIVRFFGKPKVSMQTT